LVAIIVVLLPYLTAFSPGVGDSSFTRIWIGAETGEYAKVSRDCEGNVLGVEHRPSSEFSAGIDHEFSPVVVGVRAGRIPSESAQRMELVQPELEYIPSGTAFALLPSRLSYVSPHIGITSRWFGISGGPIFIEGSHSMKISSYPSASLRIGRTEGMLFFMHFMDEEPLLTGGLGPINLGIEFPLRQFDQRIAFGLGGGLYDGVMVGGRYKFDVTPYVRLGLSGTLGFDYGEYGLSLSGAVTF
jgi:hypothetical protein